MSYYSALRWTRLMIVSGISRSEALRRIDYPLDLPEDISGRELADHLHWKVEAWRFSMRQRVRLNFWRFGPILIWAVLFGFFLVGRVVVFSPLAPLFQGMNLSLPMPTRWLLEPNWYLHLSTVLPLFISFRRRNERKNEQAEECWNILAAPDPSQALDLIRTEPRFLSLALILNAADERGNLRATAVAWARGIEWDLRWRLEQARFRRFVLLLVGSILVSLSCSLAVGLPFYQLLG